MKITDKEIKDKAEEYVKPLRGLSLPGESKAIKLGFEAGCKYIMDKIESEPKTHDPATLTFYRLEEFEHDEYARHHGYFLTLDSAMKKALEIVRVMQKEILEMREYVKAEGLDDDNYKEDMHLIENSKFAAQWEGNYRSLIIYKNTTHS